MPSSTVVEYVKMKSYRPLIQWLAVQVNHYNSNNK